MIGAIARLFALLVALAVCAGVALVVYASLGNGFLSGRLLPNGWDQPVSDSPQPPQVFSIQAGESANAVGDDLQRRGLIRSSMAFRWKVETRGIGGRLAAGDYELSPSMSVDQVVDAFERGPINRDVTLTVPEGWRLEQLAQRIEESHLARAEDILRIARSPREYGLKPPDPAAETLEGYLFPDTYRLDPKVTPQQIVETMLRQFDRRVPESVRRQAAARGLSLHQTVTLASIVEREASRPDERPLVASVYANRLGDGTKLDADPTVQYAVANLDLGVAAGYGYWKRDLTVDDLQVDSPYNTYRRPGLPPGPICSPGLDSIQAAVAPADTGYRYFVARGDGSHAFADTPEEHARNVSRYQR